MRDSNVKITWWFGVELTFNKHVFRKLEFTKLSNSKETLLQDKMHLMHYFDEQGNRVYTLKVGISIGSLQSGKMTNNVCFPKILNHIVHLVASVGGG